MSERINVNYYTFYIRDISQSTCCYNLDLNKFLINKINNLKKNNINLIQHKDGESMRLEFHKPGYFSFLKSRNAEYIKAVDVENNVVKDINAGEDKPQKIAFLSHFVIENSLIAYARSTLSPHCTVLADLVNIILNMYFDGRYEFVIRPLMETISKDEVLKMKHIGKTSIEVEQESSLFTKLMELMGAINTNYLNIGSVELVFKPLKSKDIKDTTFNLIDIHKDDKSIKNFKMQVKSDLYDNLIDVYLDGKGRFSDYILIDNPIQFGEKLRIKIQTNKLIQKKIMEYKNECEAQKQRFEAYDTFYSESHWTDSITNQTPSK